MAWRSTGSTNAELIANLVSNSLLASPLIQAAMLTVDRAHYVPHPSSAYLDAPQAIGHGATISAPQAIGHGATISAPHMHASALESLLPYISAGGPGARPRRVLDVGSGSGYLTHVLGELVGDGGRVVAVEHIEALRELGEGNLRKSVAGRGLVESGRVRFVVGDGRKGWVEEGEAGEVGWDAIHVGASARVIHEELVRQLRRPGRMFIPVDDDATGYRQHIWVVDKDEKGEVVKKKLYGVSYVPLTDAPK